MREAEGDHDLAALALGISKSTLKKRIRGHHVLDALYGGVDRRVAGSEDVITRRAKDLPVGAELNDHQLAQLVIQQDREIQFRGYEKLGIDPKTIKKFRTLDGLAKTMGHFLSESVKTSYQMFSIQQIHLFERAEEVRDLLATKLPTEERRYYEKYYLDLVREVNRGHQMQFAAAEALVKMLAAAKGGGAAIPQETGRKNKKLRLAPRVATPGE